MITRLTVRVVSCDAKVIGSLVGGCRITVRDHLTGEVLARGLHSGGSGDTQRIMKEPHSRGAVIYGTPETASFVAELDLNRPTLVEVTAEGPLAFPQAMHKTSVTTWLLPGRHVEGEGLVLQLFGFIVDIMTPESADVLHSYNDVHLQASVRLL